MSFDKAMAEIDAQIQAAKQSAIDHLTNADVKIKETIHMAQNILIMDFTTDEFSNACDAIDDFDQSNCQVNKYLKRNRIAIIF